MRLFLLSPTVAFAARVNQASFAYPIDEVEYDTVTTGSFSNILPNMTVYFGSSAGANDLGITRVRKLADSNTLFFGRSSQGVHFGEVNLSDNIYITVLYDWRVWPKISYITLDTPSTRYMDSDLDFATWGADNPPVANAGPGFAGTINSGTSLITVAFSAAASFTTEPGATISSYAWLVRDGTITVGSSSTSTMTATFPVGFRWVTLGIIDSNGQSHYTHVPVLAMAATGSPCISNFTIERHTIGIEGQEISVRVRDSIPASTYPDGTLAMIVDGEPASSSDRTNVLFQGWADQEPTEIEADGTATLRDVTLNLVDVAGRMRSLPGFSQVLENIASPTLWGQMTNPNMDRFIHFLLQWQSTVLDLADFTWSGTTTTYPFSRRHSDGASLWEQAARRAEDIIPDYKFTCNTRGQLRVIVDPMLIDSGSRTSTVQATLDAGDYSNLRYTQQRNPRYNKLYGQAVLTSTALADAGVASSVFSVAPGLSPGFGEGDMTDGFNLAVSQDALNAYTGHKYARINAPQSLFSMTLAEGSTQGIQPADMTWVRLTIPSTVAAQRGLTFTNERGLVHQIDIRYQSTRTALIRTVSLQWERETVKTADGIIEPVLPAEEVEDGAGTPVIIPTEPTAPPSFDGGVLSTTENIALIAGNGRILRTANFSDASPNWTNDGTLATDFSGTEILSFVVDPFSPLYRGTGTTVNGYGATLGGIWKIEDIFAVDGGPTATSLHTFTQSISLSGGRWRSIAASFGRYFPTETDNPWLMVVTNYGSIGTKNGSHAIYSLDAGQTWSTEIEISADYDTQSMTNLRMYPALWLSPRTPGYAITVAWTTTDALFTDPKPFETHDWGATWSEMTSPVLTAGDGHLAGCIHVPWPDNADEQVMYHGYTIGGYIRYLIRTDGATETGIAPGISPSEVIADVTYTYGPREGNFGVRTYDGNRNYVAMAGFSSRGTDDILADYAAVYYSDDAGATWTQVTTPVQADTNDQWPAQVAFAADDPNYVLIWGNECYVATYESGVWHDKTGDLSFSGERVPGLVGGDG